jgi:transposase
MAGSELKALLYPTGIPQTEKQQQAYPDWEAVHLWLKGGRRRNLQYAWEEYRRRESAGLSYSQFCRRYKSWKDSTGKTVTMVQTHEPGKESYIDWAGDTLDCVVDTETGELLTAHFFLSVLGYSCYPYVEAFPNEQMDSWITANINALEHFQGVPRIGVPDNVTTAVTKPHYYDPKLNPTFLEFAQYYGIAIMPARPAKPKDKSTVEGSIGWLETWLLEWLRDQYFYSFSELNRAIKQRVKALSERPFQKRPGSRLSEYEDFDKPALRPLPAIRYSFAQFVTRSVPDSYHVEYDSFYYSVHYSLFKQEVTVRATSTTIEIINGDRERVAFHSRSYSGKRYITIPEHMPERHRRQMEASGRTGEDYLKWAGTIGTSTHMLIGKMLRSQAFEETAYRGCMGVLQSAKKYSREQLEDACRRALDVGSPYYTTVINLLKNPPLPKRAQPLPIHTNLRNPAEFS